MKTLYQCEFCGSTDYSAGTMSIHENCCDDNPKNYTIEKMIEKYTDMLDGYSDENEMYDVGVTFALEKVIVDLKKILEAKN